MAGATVSAVRNFLETHRDRWPFTVPVGIGTGICLYFSLPAEPAWYAGPLVSTGALVAVILSRQWSAGFRIVILMTFLVALGFAAASIRTHAIEGRLLGKETAFTRIEGRVVELQPFDQGARLILDHVLVSRLPAHETPAQVRIRIRGDQPILSPGDWISVRGRLSPPSPPVLPGGFDFQRHAFFNGIGAVGFSVGKTSVLDGPPPGPFAWRIHLAKVRLAVTERVREIIPGNAGAVAAALLTGHRTVIPEPVLEDFRRAGLAHLLAISGLHIGLAAGIIFFGLRGLFVLSPTLAMRFPVKKVAALAALVIAGAYALLAGATVPTQRAFFIAGLVLVAVMVDRRGVSLRLLAWAAAVILVLQPESLLGPSFQMSFAAAIALVSAYEVAAERNALSPKRARDRWLAGIALYAGGVAFTTVVASLATAPFVVFHFNEVAKYGLLANLIAVPVTALWVMPAAMVSFLLMPFGAEAVALTVMGWGIDIVIAVTSQVSRLPQATAIFPSAPTWALIVLSLSALWICLARGRARLAGVLGVGIWVASVALVRPPDILVAGDGKLAAVLDDRHGYRFSTLSTARFAREGWLSHAGFSPEGRGKWPDDGSGNAAFRCDGHGCIIRKNGASVGLALSPHSLSEDCGTLTMTIATVPARGICPSSAQIIDIFDLGRRGTHAIWLGPMIRVEAVNDTRGNRPWVVPSARQDRIASE